MNTLRANLHYFYLLLALVGGGFTFYFVMKGTAVNGGAFNVIDFVRSTWTDNDYARSLTLDFWTGAVAGSFFVLVEGMRLRMKRFWLYMLLIVGIGYAFGFPLFLFMRQRHLNRNQTPKP